MKAKLAPIIRSVKGVLQGYYVGYDRKANQIVNLKKKRSYNKSDEDKGPGSACTQWKKLDLMWQNFPQATKDLWNAAVTKPATTGYNVWMSEAIYHCSHNAFLPDVPSASGGWTHGPLHPGVRYAPLPKILKPTYYGCPLCPGGASERYTVIMRPSYEDCHFWWYQSPRTLTVHPMPCIWRYYGWTGSPYLFRMDYAWQGSIDSAPYGGTCWLFFISPTIRNCLQTIKLPIVAPDESSCPHGKHEGAYLELIPGPSDDDPFPWS